MTTVASGIPHFILPCSEREVATGDILTIDKVKAGGKYVPGERRVRSIGSAGLGLGSGTDPSGPVTTWIDPKHPAIVEHRSTR